MTLTLSGTTLVGLVSWNDLYRLPGGLDLHAGVPRGSQVTNAVFFPEFPAKRSGSYSARIDLSNAFAYSQGFLRKHGNQVDAGRAALVVALNAGEGYVAVRSQQMTIPPEIGARLVLVPDREEPATGRLRGGGRSGAGDEGSMCPCCESRLSLRRSGDALPA